MVRWHHRLKGHEFEQPTLTSLHDYWKNHTWTIVCKVMSLLFNMLSRFIRIFLPRSKHLFISWLQSQSAVILEPQKIKSVTVSTFSPIYLSWNDGTRCHDLRFLNVEVFHFPLSPSSQVSLVPLCFLPLGWCHLHIWSYWCFSWQSWFQLLLHPAWHFARCILHIN